MAMQTILSARPQRVRRGQWYRDRWLQAASQTGWSVTRQIGSYVELSRAGQARLVNGPDAGLDRHINFRLAGSSTLSAIAFGDAGVPIPETQEYSLLRPRHVLDHIVSRPGLVVVKPAADTGGGRGVTVAPTTIQHGLRALRDVAAYTKQVIVQDIAPGAVLRVLVLDGCVIDAVERSPAVIRGDGVSSVRQLITAENQRREQLRAMATGFIPIATDCRVALARQELSLRSVPDNGEDVVASGCSNTGSESQSERIRIGEQATAVSVRAAAAVGVRLAGVDLVVDDVGEPKVVLEVNGAPGLHWHVLVDGDPFDPFVAALGPDC